MSYATVSIWLDYPFWKILYQICKRTLKRSFTKEELWPGCRESFRHQLFSKQSIFVFAFKSYSRRKKRIPPLIEKYPHVEMIRIHKLKDLSSLLEDRFGLDP